MPQELNLKHWVVISNVGAFIFPVDSIPVAPVSCHVYLITGYPGA